MSACSKQPQCLPACTSVQRALNKLMRSAMIAKMLHKLVPLHNQRLTFVM